MISRCAAIVLGIFLTTLTGCYTIGHDFSRPPLERFELRKTTQSQVLAAVGTPASITNTERNGKRIERFQYTYFTAAGYAAGVGPVGRMASFFFSDGQLIGYLYTSSFPGDSTDFEIERSSRLEKGKSTKVDVEALFGKAQGVVLFPLADGEGNSQLRYNYTGATGVMGASDFISKDLLIFVNSEGIVTEFTASSERK